MISKIILKLVTKIIINFLGLIYLLFNLPILILSFYFPQKIKRNGVFYGGIPIESSGGPYQKIRLLKRFLGEQKLNFKCIYILSGSLRIPLYILKIYKLLNVKIIINQNGVFYPMWYKKNDLEQKNKILYQYNQISNITLFQSKFALKSYVKFVGSLPKNYKIIYNTVDTDIFYPLKIKRRKNKLIKILIAGNFYNYTEDYRVLLSIKAVHLLVKQGYLIKLIIAGNLSDRLIKIINDKKLEFLEIIGSYDQVTANRIFNNSDIYLHLHYMGCCDNILLEMMACGKHVIALNNGGNPELLLEDHCTLIPCKNNWEKQINPNTKIISKYIKFCLDNKTRGGTELVNHIKSKFSLKKWLSNHREIINNI